VPFTINTASITSISPNNGLAGTQVTIMGSGFGATQGNGNVWLGTAPAIVNSWSDGEVIATVAAVATTGNALILQNGAMSNAIQFTINLPQITGISPNTGSAGTVVTITGSGFGSAQGSGTVLIGSAYGSVIGWSNTEVTASVAENAVSGIVQIQQNGSSSNGIGFIVPQSFGSGTPAASLVPNQINMVVGGTQSIEAVNSSGQSITGLSWTSSNTSVATLSTDDPPIITAVGLGVSTITAGGTSAIVNILAGSTLPTGTTIWSNPGDGTGVSNIMPAVPSSTGIADIFAFNTDGNVQAITASGITAWTSSVGSYNNVNFLPDFQGGLEMVSGTAINRLDGMTGISSLVYNLVNPSPSGLPPSTVVGTDGTVFTIDASTVAGANSYVVGTNPSTGNNFNITLENSTSTYASNLVYVPGPPFCTLSPLPQGGGLQPGNQTVPPLVGNLIVAGDGYAYVPYLYYTSEGGGTSAYGPGSCYYPDSSNDLTTWHLRLMRVGTAGDSYEITLGDYNSSQSGNNTVTVYISGLNIITNADQGVLASWELDTTVGDNPTTTTFNLATTQGTNVSQSTMSIPGQAAPVQPILQRQDGNFIGTVGIGPQPGQVTQTNMIGFTPSGGTLFNVPNDTPQIATADNGVIGTSGTTYDQNGNVNGFVPNMPVLSWPSFAYQMAPINQISFMAPQVALSFWGLIDGNPSGDNPVAVKLQHARVFIPYGLYNLPTESCTVTSTSTSCLFSAPVINPQDSAFQKEALGAVPAWKSVMDIRIPASGSATIGNYLPFATTTTTDTIKETNDIVAYIGHGVGQPNSPQNGSYESISMGLLFPSSQCLWFQNLQPPPLTTPWIFACQNAAVKGVTQKPIIIFLGICGFTSQMLGDWTVDTNNQVIIYPTYSSSNTANELDLGLAGNEFLAFIQSLVQGNTVNTALSQMNTQTQTDITNNKTKLAPTERWSWTSYGNTNFTLFTAP
jgi:IPT/TIG domain